MRGHFACALAALLLAFCPPSPASEPLTVTLHDPAPAEAGYFKMGTARSANGHVLTLDSRSLRLDGQPWLPVMGEFHFTRYPADEWREELLKMKAGGIDIVATYVFWIHHEETEGQWNWSERRNLRQFVEIARDVGLHVIVRSGPWCHGEVRNGGLPDWTLQRGWKVRTTDPGFMQATRGLYAQIAAQVAGLLWKQGGPVIGIQLDNEYYGPAEYLVALKRLAQEAGLDVPLYTRTGWPALSTPMPLGEMIPLYGVYAEGFWDRHLTSMPGRYWSGFHFSTLRTDTAIATELLGERAAKDEPDAARYPYLTCEIGGGMMSSYHRRIRVDPRDIEATTLIKVAGGSTGPGYYMYHGGTNPDGRTTLMEAQDTAITNYNDLPEKTYDFQAPLGEYGQVRPHYHRLRRLHLFLRDYGSDLTSMVTALPAQRPAGRNDETTLRWAARSDGRRGFVFINNHERGRTLPPKADVRFALGLTSGEGLEFPRQPVTVPSGAMAWWPFNLDIGGLTLVSATAQPVTHVVEGNGTRTVFFAETPGVPAEFVLLENEVAKLETTARVEKAGGRLRLEGLQPSRDIAFRVATANGKVLNVVLLADADSLALWKGEFAGRRRVFLSRLPLSFAQGGLNLTATEAEPGVVGIFPAPGTLTGDGGTLAGRPDGLFTTYDVPVTARVSTLAFESVRRAGELRTIPKGPIKEPVAMAPKAADFAQAAEWTVRVPSVAGPRIRGLLRFHYRGDVARLYHGDTLLTDDFYQGLPREFGLWRLPAPAKPGNGVPARSLRFQVLPFQPDAAVFLDPQIGPRPDRPVAELLRVELVEYETKRLTGAPGPEPALPNHFRTDAITPRPTPLRR